MFMQEFNTRYMLRKTGEVMEAARKEPVRITRQAKGDVVMMSREKYIELVNKSQK